MSPGDGRDGDDRVGVRGLRLRAPVAGGSEPSGGSEDDDEDEAFAEAMRGARPLARGSERVAAQPAGAPRRRASGSAVASAFAIERSGDTIAGRAPDVSLKLLRELRAGRPAPETRIDLHGRARAAALRDLERFVTSARARDARCLLVIHGRGRGSEAGGPVLRPAVWDWLASAAAARGGVMAFTSARPADGGDGATVVLVRRNAR